MYFDDDFEMFIFLKIIWNSRHGTCVCDHISITYYNYIMVLNNNNIVNTYCL